MIGGQTARLLVEPLAHAHADGLVAALAHPSVGAYLGGPDVTTVAALHARIDRLARGPGRPDERWLNFVVRRRATGVIAGRIEATVHGTWAELAYVFGPAHGGRGYAREAVAWLLAGLTHAGVDELWAAVHPANARSIRLLEALGFVEAPAGARPLGSYDPGDRVFRRGPPSAAAT